MSVMYGQVCGRWHDGDKIAAPDLDSVVATLKPVRSNHLNADVSRGELKGTVVTPKARNARNASKDKMRKPVVDVAQYRLKVEHNDIARTVQTGAVLRDPNAAPEIGEYHRRWADKYVYVETCGQNRRAFDTVAGAVSYINALEGTEELTEPWLSFLLVNQICKYRIYKIGLEDKVFTDRALRQRDEKDGEE